MRIDTRPRKRNAPRPAWKVAEAFKQWLRGRDCAVSNLNCDGRMESAHVDFLGSKGMGTKTEDRHCIPLCTFHHRAQHTRGWLTFQADHKMDAAKLSDAYWQQWPGRAKWESENG